jgi:hypothetical protein
MSQDNHDVQSRLGHLAWGVSPGRPSPPAGVSPLGVSLAWASRLGVSLAWAPRPQGRLASLRWGSAYQIARDYMVKSHKVPYISANITGFGAVVSVRDSIGTAEAVRNPGEAVRTPGGNP